MMRIPTTRFSLSRFALLLIAILAACSFQKEKSGEQVVANPISPEEEMAQLLASGMQQAPGWLAHWKAYDAAFDPSAFAHAKTLEFEGLEWPEENFIQSGSPFFPYLIPHPEGAGTVDIYSYKVVIPEDGSVSYNPDSEVIFFKSNGMRERLLFIGPSGGFQEAVWVSPEFLMVTGFFEDDRGVAPMVWMINVSKRQYLEYSGTSRVTGYPKSDYLKAKLKNISLPADEVGPDRQ